MTEQEKRLSSDWFSFGRICWLALGLGTLDLAFALACSSDTLVTSHLGPLAKMSLFATNYIFAGLAVILACLGWRLFSYLIARHIAHKPLLVTVFGVNCLVAGFLAFLLSWALYRDTRQFLDHYAVALAGASLQSTFAHALSFRPVELLLGLPVSLVITASAIVWSNGAPWKHFASHVPTRIWLYGLVYPTVLLVLCTNLYFIGTERRYTDSDTGATMPAANAYIRCRDNHLSPLAHFFADSCQTFRTSHDLRLSWLQMTQGSEDDARLARHPIVPMAEYVKTTREGTTKRLNVIVLLVESLRADQLTMYGSPRCVMPTVDRIAEDAIVFPRAYTNASHSDYADLCPLSSHYPLRDSTIHVYPKNPPYPRVLFYDVLKSLDYRTAIVSSQNEHWGCMANYLDTGNLDLFLHAATYTGPTYIAGEDSGFAQWASGGKHSGKIDDYWTITEAIKWTAKQNDSPFALYINLQNSHIPYVIPESFPRQFSPEKVDFTIGFNNYPRDKATLVKDVYADSLGYVDQQIGRLVEALKQNGQWDRTLLVITGDTGQAFYEHGFAAHANRLYEEAMRVPLIFHVPGEPHQRIDVLAEHVDVPPTILGFLNLPPHPSFQGVDLLDPGLTQTKEAFLLAQSPLAQQVAIVGNEWKLIYDLGEQRCYLYNLKDDPGEHQDLSLARPELTDAMARRLRTWCKAQLEYYGDTQRPASEYPPVVLW